jgi:hypothetical protein
MSSSGILMTTMLSRDGMVFQELAPSQAYLMAVYFS